ncbi:hypothetical protein IT418_00915 [bacterium]|nr:hypothetical protein [bacterium]
MLLEKRLYSHKEVGQIIQQNVREIVELFDQKNDLTVERQAVIINEWARALLPSIEQAVALEIVKRHVLGITLAAWIGPPGSGKSTNIEAVNVLGKVYAEVASQGVAEVLPEPFHSMLLGFSLSEATISTGTKGMFNRPEGEYLALFDEIGKIVSQLVTMGGFVPDDLVSVLVELMILYRLTQNFHKIQIDLWPRTKPQFEVFSNLLKIVAAEGGMARTELVILKVLPPKALSIVTENIASCASRSREIARSISFELDSEWYKQAVVQSQAITDTQKRFEVESVSLVKLFSLLRERHTSDIDRVVLEELQTVCDRMAFRFKIVTSKGAEPRPDEFPLHVMRRIAVFTGETSPVFLDILAENKPNFLVYLVSAAGTPAEVIAEVLDAIAQEKSDNLKWVGMKEVAGKIADSIVSKQPLIVEELQQRVGSILKA